MGILILKRTTGGGAVSIDAAFDAIRNSAGIFYDEDFTQYSDSSELIAAQDKGFHSPGFGTVQLIDAGSTGLGSAKAIRLIQHDRGSKGGSWGQRYDTQGGNTQYTEFYWLNLIRLNKAMKEWRWDGTSASEDQTKLINWEQFGSGQVVLTRARHNPGPGILLNGSGMLGREFSNPYSHGTDSMMSSGVGQGTSLPGTPTLEDAIRTYGWAWRGIAENEFDESDTSSFDLSFKSSAQTGGDPTQNFLGHAGRNWPYGGYGLPEIMHPDFQQYPADDWMVIEAHVRNSATASERIVTLACAPLGQAPKLQIAYNLTGGGTRETDLSNNATYYSEWELLIYNTPTTDLGTDRPAAVGYQPDLVADYSRILISTQPILFPNLLGEPHALPSGF